MEVNIKPLNARNCATRNKTQPVVLIAGSRFFEMLLPEETVTCKYTILIPGLALGTFNQTNISSNTATLRQGQC